MRYSIYMVAGLLLTGCAVEKPAMPQNNMSSDNTDPAISRASAALVFDVPITTTEPEIQIARADRGAAAFAGFQDISVSAYDIISYDRQSSDRGDRFVRQSITEQAGTLQR